MNTQHELVIGGKTARSTLGQHPVSIDFAKLPDASQEFIVKYGLKQYLADATAGASDQSDAAAKIKGRVDKLLSGDLSRTKGDGISGPDSQETRTKKLARQAVRELAKAKGATLTKEQIEAAATAWIAKDDKFAKEAKKQLDAEAKAKAEAVEGADDDILASLGIELPAED